MKNKLKLVDINEENWNDYVSLHPGDEGANYVASNAYSLAQACFEKTWIVKGITHNDIPIGFTMYGLDHDLGTYELCRLMISHKLQNQGFGHHVLPLIIDKILNKWQPDEIYLSTDPKNEKAIRLYEKHGFKKTGEISYGEAVFSRPTKH